MTGFDGGMALGKNDLRNFALRARKNLIEQVAKRAALLVLPRYSGYKPQEPSPYLCSGCPSKGRGGAGL